MNKEEKSLIDSPNLATLAVAAGSKFLLEGLGAGAVGAAVVSSPLLVATLIGAGAFYVGKLFTEDNKSEEGKLLDSLKRTSLDVSISTDGQMTTTASTSVEATKPTKPTEQVVVENRKGITVIHIDNLTFTLNAELVQQLNMNPKEVINQLAEQIQQKVNSNKLIKKDEQGTSKRALSLYPSPTQAQTNPLSLGTPWVELG